MPTTIRQLIAASLLITFAVSEGHDSNTGRQKRPGSAAEAVDV